MSKYQKVIWVELSKQEQEVLRKHYNLGNGEIKLKEVDSIFPYIVYCNNKRTSIQLGMKGLLNIRFLDKNVDGSEVK